MRDRPRRAGASLVRLLAIVVLLVGCVDAGKVASADPTDAQRPSTVPIANAPLEHEFGRIIAEGIDLWSEPGGGMQIVSTSGDLGLLVPILDRRTVDGVEWVHIEHWSPRSSSRFVWMPTEADIATAYGTTHGPTIEPATPDCQALQRPDADVLAWTPPPVRLACLGAVTMQLGPVFVGSWRSDFPVGGEPAWLAVAAGVRLYSARGWKSRDVGLDIQVDPSGNLSLPVDTWVNVDGQFDHPAAATCVRTGAAQEAIGDRDLHVLWCRQQFVVTAVAPAEPPALEPEPTEAPALAGRWSATSPAPVQGRVGHSGVWTGRELVVWGGHPGPRSVDDKEVTDGTVGAAYDPAADAWRVIAAAPLAPRVRHVVAWTGTEMLVWGGHTADNNRLADGAAYNPATDTWRPIVAAPLPGRGQSVGTWTGDRWLVLDGMSDADAPMTLEAAAYDPATDTWSTLPSVELPASWSVSAAWTGDGLLVLANPNRGRSVAMRLDVAANAWSPLAAPPFDGLNTGGAAWTGEGWLVPTRTSPNDPLGQKDLMFRYVPSSDRWEQVASPPGWLRSFDPIWTGRHVLFLPVIGQVGAVSGMAYEPGTDGWRTLSAPEIPVGEFASAVWTGDRLVSWGGGVGESFVRPIEGAVFVPEQ